jgi:squalene-associated FAD-dependent desaturase
VAAENFDIAVIGGGVAGLAAATALAEAGTRVLVLEARGGLGGRATAFIDRDTGDLVDNGQHVLFGCYRETFRLLRRIGAEGNVRTQPSLEVPYLDVSGRRSVLRCPSLPSPLHLVAGIFGWDALSWSDRLSVLRVAGPLLKARRNFRLTNFRLKAEATGERSASAFRRKETETVDAWLTRHGQRGRLREWLWEPLAVAALNQAPGEAAAEPFVKVLAEMFGPLRSDSALVLPLKPLHEMYALPAKRYVEARGGEVRLNALARVRIAGGRVAGVEVRGEKMRVSRVVSAVPWFALESLLVGDVESMTAIVAAASAMASKPIVTVNLWYDRAVMDDLFVGLPGREMQWVFDKRRAFGETASHLSLVASGADALVGADNPTLVALAAREVAASIPGARDAVLKRGTVIREKRATFSLAPGEPARPGVATPVGGLFLAGDWIDTGLPGTIESAAAAGHMAARSALATLPPPVVNLQSSAGNRQ